MADFTHLNLIEDVEDIAPKHGMDPQMQARYARRPLELKNSGLSLFRVAPNFRVPFGHRHGEQEEIYVVLEGGARFKVEDELVEMREFDALRVPPSTTRGMEGGPDGALILAVGAPNTDNKDAEMVQDFWPASAGQ
jgi:mannose-6-phosphate isomerase-like protein (cupin superfamily)